ncbi:TetR/AcrR family transcriptional regulator [Kibdelosporangium philippinense]|uniref:TetR/AcrR family transcriptional regulator n=1 Tax=Kibdelosporangium philippinense TaxID=211113 RepID=A0ABS8ZUE0_9PSEU|nr:TetR/AcrR family transcriptional regulator [Kibdelosporangium philippinense]MCE7011309.1 TetR/AcrR family transcriptional regulator [Kibdelosporangium philippinense]
MSSKTSERTRLKVLEAARDLFNERGTAAVSTNHIAAGAGISPGNLYYHFRDKQQIIHALFDRYARELDDRWRPDRDAGKNLAVLGRNLAEAAALSWEYRFFQREMLVLLRADDRLRAAYDVVYERRFSEQRSFAQELVLQNVIRVPQLPRTIDDLITALWLVAEGWQPFLDLTSDPTDEQQVARVTDLLMVVLEPYLTDEGRRLFEGET